MTLRMGDLFAEAGAIWRAERALVLPLAGLFYFLPAFALMLLLPEAVPAKGGDDQAALEALVAYARDNAGPILFVNLLQLVGTAVLLTLFLSPNRPDLSSAMRLAGARMIAFVGASVLMWAALTVSALLIVPALYLIGRFFLTTSALASGDARGPVEAITRSVAMTRGRGWMCFGMSAIIFFAGQAGVSLAGGVDQALIGAGSASPLLHLVINGVAALAATFSWVMTLLVKIVAYRRLSKGI